MRALLEAHRYTRGLELLPPGTATNVTDQAPDGAGRLDVGALFDAEFDRPAPPPRRRQDSATRRRPPTSAGRSARPAAAAARARHPPARPPSSRPAAADPEPELARAANQALWPATWGAGPTR